MHEDATATIPFGFSPDEVVTDQPTRAARLKWVVVVDAALAPGRAVNAAVCAASATAVNVRGLLGPDGEDDAGGRHPGLPWSGCTVLAATRQELADLRAKVAGMADVFVADMPSDAQDTRVYDEYLDRLAARPAGEITYCAVSLVGPRNRVDKLVKRLSLLP